MARYSPYRSPSLWTRLLYLIVYPGELCRLAEQVRGKTVAEGDMRKGRRRCGAGERERISRRYRGKVGIFVRGKERTGCTRREVGISSRESDCK